MANVKYGVVVTELKGSIAGMTFQGGRSSGILRVKPRGNNLNITASNEQRQYALNVLSFVSKLWTTRTNAQRLTWSDLIGVWTFTDKFGDPYNGTPYQIFCSVNSILLANGLNPIANAPTYTTGTEIPISTITMVYGGDYTLQILDSVTYDSTLQISASKPVKPSVDGSRISYTRIENHVNAGATTINFTGAYQKIFGSNLQSGNIVWIKTRQFVPSYPRYEFVQTFKIVVS